MLLFAMILHVQCFAVPEHENHFQILYHNQTKKQGFVSRPFNFHLPHSYLYYRRHKLHVYEKIRAS